MDKELDQQRDETMDKDTQRPIRPRGVQEHMNNDEGTCMESMEHLRISMGGHGEYKGSG